MKQAIIAVDAGGTKTKVCAFSEDETIVYQAIGESGSPAVIPQDQALGNIFRLVDEVYSHVKDNWQVTFVQIGMSGLGVIRDIKKLENELSDTIGNTEVSIVSDAVIALYSIIENKYKEGVLVLSGTGSIVYGINTDEETMAIGGFGHLLTETGSSFYVVKQLICDAILHYEESKTYRSLDQKFMALIGADNINDFKVFMYHRNKNEVADYAKFISEQALLGDKDAIAILKKAGRDLAHSVSLLYKHLNLTDSTVIGYRGSFIQKAAFIQEELLDTLRGMNIFPNVVRGLEDPIYGAYYMALRKGKL
jgi:N-acetylglucosamine kinase-like BadF-type ATPase